LYIVIDRLGRRRLRLFRSTCGARRPPANRGDTEGRRVSKDAYRRILFSDCPRRDFVASLSWPTSP